MYAPRSIVNVAGIAEQDGLKLYTIAAHDGPVDATAYLDQLAILKSQQAVPWQVTPAFAIFHDGAQFAYLVLAWWGNENELFVRVAVREADGWVVAPERYSFCLWDIDVMWFERGSYIRNMYSGSPSLASYRLDRMPPDKVGAAAP